MTPAVAQSLLAQSFICEGEEGGVGWLGCDGGTGDKAYREWKLFSCLEL